MVTATSTTGIKRRLLLNKEVILVDSDDALSFKMDDDVLNEHLTFNFKFGPPTQVPLSTTGDISPDGNTINMTFNDWNEPSGISFVKPIELKTIIGKTIWIQANVSLSAGSKTRIFHLSIWGEE